MATSRGPCAESAYPSPFFGLTPRVIRPKNLPEPPGISDCKRSITSYMVDASTRRPYGISALETHNTD